MWRAIASLTLAVSILAVSRLAAASPPMPPAPAYPSEPRTLSDLKAIESRVQWVMAKVMPAVVGLGGGSGIVVSSSGLILTAAHVNGKASRTVFPIFPDGKRVRGKTLGNHRGIDAGMAQISQTGAYPYAPMGRSADLKVGQWVVTMGFPVSFAKGTRPPVRVGRILQVLPNAFVTDCPMMGGDSGGPVFDMEGRVIGVNSRVDNSGVMGNVHVPVDIYRDFGTRMRKGEDWGTPLGQRSKSAVETAYQRPPKRRRPGRRDFPPPRRERESTPDISREGVKAAFLGATRPSASAVVRILCDGEAAALGTVVDAEGLIVTKASLLQGEIICVLRNGREALATKLGEDKECDLAVLRVDARVLRAADWRDGAPLQGSLVAAVGDMGSALALGTVTAEPRHFRLSDRPSRVPASSLRAFLGVGVEEDEDGLRVATLTPGSGAEKAGVRLGDLLVKLNGKAVKSADDLRVFLEKRKIGDKVAIVVERNGKDEKLTATLGRQTAAPPKSAYDKWGGGPFSERRFGFGKVLPIDVPVAPEDCGGPVVDTSGKVVGVCIARALRVSTFVLLPEDVKRIVAKVTAREK